MESCFFSIYHGATFITSACKLKQNVEHYFKVSFQAAISFLGVGNMGKHMAMNLLAVNHRLTLFDTDSKAYEHFKGQSK